MHLNLTEVCFALWAIFAAAAESEKRSNKLSKNEVHPLKNKTTKQRKNKHKRKKSKTKKKLFLTGGAGPLAPRKRAALAPS